MAYVLDTHAAVWFLQRDTRLGANARDAMRDPSGQLVIPSIVLAEVAFLHGRRRISLSVEQVLGYVQSVRNCIVHPLDEYVARHLPPALNIHDAIIVATALVCRESIGEPMAVITKDREIVGSGIVDTVW